MKLQYPEWVALMWMAYLACGIVVLLLVIFFRPKEFAYYPWYRNIFWGLLCLLLWVAPLWDLLLDVLNWWREQSKPKYRFKNKRNMLAIVALMGFAWIKVSVEPASDYPGFYRVKYRNELGQVRTVLTDDTCDMKGGAL